MSRVRVKICGVTRTEDARAAVAAGADAVGVVFYPPSPRWVTLDQAREIRLAVGPLVTVVGLFLDQDAAAIRAALDTVPLDLIQFHGAERARFCDSFGRPYVKAVPMSGPLDVVRYTAGYPRASGFLFDSHAPGQRGGTGSAFDWNRIPNDLGRPMILAGGLEPENVEQAVRATSPYAVDVSSGVESAPGIKSEALILEFMRGVARGDSR